MPEQHCQSTPTLGEGCTRIFRCNMLPEHLAEWPMSFTCHCGNGGGGGGKMDTQYKSQHRMVTLEEKILPPLLFNNEIRETQETRSKMD